MLCASVRDTSRQCWAAGTAAVKVLGLWNRYNASDRASAGNTGLVDAQSTKDAGFQSHARL